VWKEHCRVPFVWLVRAAHGVGGGFGEGHELSLSKLAARPCHWGEEKPWLVTANKNWHFNFQNFTGSCTEFTFFQLFSKLSRFLLSAMQKHKENSLELLVWKTWFPKRPTAETISASFTMWNGCVDVCVCVCVLMRCYDWTVALAIFHTENQLMLAAKEAVCRVWSYCQERTIMNY
jgi:hypothetical protein